MKINPESDGRFTLSARAPNWKVAGEMVATLRDSPPPGFKMVIGQIFPRTRDDGSIASGARCNYEVTYEPKSRGVVPDIGELWDFFIDAGVERPES